MSALSDYLSSMNTATTNYTTGVSSTLSPYAELASSGDYAQKYSDYLNALSGSDTSQYKTSAATLTAVNPLEDVSSYIDPDVEYQKEAAAQGIQESAAGEGGLFSGATGSKIATSDEELASQAWSDAYDKALAAQEENNAIAQAQQAANQSAGTYNLGLDQTQLSNLGTAYDTSMSPLDTLTAANLSTLGTVYNADTGAAGTTYQSTANQPSTLESILSGIGNLGSAASGISKIISLF